MTSVPDYPCSVLSTKKIIFILRGWRRWRQFTFHGDTAFQFVSEISRARCWLFHLHYVKTEKVPTMSTWPQVSAMSPSRDIAAHLTLPLCSLAIERFIIEKSLRIIIEEVLVDMSRLCGEQDDCMLARHHSWYLFMIKRKIECLFVWTYPFFTWLSSQV